jgi:inosose dehydratase
VVVAATTYSFRDLPLGDALDRIAAAGLGAVEIWLPHAGDDVEAARAGLDARGLRAVAVAAGGAYAPGDQVVARGAQLALALGAPIVVACVAPGLLARIVDELDPRVTLCVENHWDQPLAHSWEVQRELAACRRAAACLDTGHALAAGDDPGTFARVLGGRLRHVHLKDARLPSRLERWAGRRVRRRLLVRPAPVFPGAGALDLRSFRRTLAELRYGGAVSIEYEGADAEAAVAALAGAWFQV